MRTPGRVREHIRHNVVGYVALFCFAIGGTAVAIPGKNKVDSGDIKAKNVKTSDLADSAVTNPKLGANAVDSGKVADNSLTGSDINESTLALPAAPTSLPPSGAAGGDLSGQYPDPELGSGVVGEAEAADRERRIMIPVADMIQNTSVNNDPPIFATSGYQAAEFDPSASTDSLFALTQVPLDRAAASPLQVRLQWEANGTGDVVWQVGAQQMTVGTNPPSVPTGADVLATSSPANFVIETSVLEIPAGALTNGAALGFSISRDGADAADTLVQSARLHLLEIRYMATG